MLQLWIPYISPVSLCCSLFVMQTLVAYGFSNDTKVVIAGLSNTYTHYITTYEEYQVLTLPESCLFHVSIVRHIISTKTAVFPSNRSSDMKELLLYLAPTLWRPTNRSLASWLLQWPR